MVGRSIQLGNSSDEILPNTVGTTLPAELRRRHCHAWAGTVAVPFQQEIIKESLPEKLRVLQIHCNFGHITQRIRGINEHTALRVARQVNLKGISIKALGDLCLLMAKQAAGMSTRFVIRLKNLALCAVNNTSMCDETVHLRTLRFNCNTALQVGAKRPVQHHHKLIALRVPLFDGRQYRRRTCMQSNFSANLNQIKAGCTIVPKHFCLRLIGIPSLALQSITGITDSNDIRQGQQLPHRRKCAWSTNHATLQVVFCTECRAKRSGEANQATQPHTS
mmetsp:Transcript_13860/g.27359  ORF Transcript_13860/g.27359 Transcript_13860/m.27359 type:complete len:277 (+) Transcript_13860:1027-1857(+)